MTSFENIKFESCFFIAWAEKKLWGNIVYDLVLVKYIADLENLRYNYARDFLEKEEDSVCIFRR